MQLCKPMFKSSTSKGSFVHGLLSFLFTILSNKKEFHEKLEHIATSHCKKGVKAVEYGIIGEILFWALKHCLTKDVYTKDIHKIWVNILSAMLAVIVPKAVKYEMNVSQDERKKRVLDQSVAYGFSQLDDTFRMFNEENSMCPVMDR